MSSAESSAERPHERIATAREKAALFKPATLGDAVMSNIRGCTDAQRLIFAIRQGCAPADALLEGVQQVQTMGDADRARGFFRELQKALERAA